MKQKIVSVCLIVCMLFGNMTGFSNAVVHAGGRTESNPYTSYITQAEGELKTREDVGFYTGLLPQQEVELPLTRENEQFLKDVVSGESDEAADTQRITKGSALYTSEWDKYKTHFFYNQLTDAEREYYDGLDKACAKLLLQNADANQRKAQDGSTIYYTDVTYSTELSVGRMRDLIMIFRYSNPQYYFVNNVTYALSNGTSAIVLMGVYAEFAYGAKRQQASAAVKRQADAWVAQANTYQTEAEKVLYLHNAICEKVDYNNAIYDKYGFDEGKEFTQTAYSVFCMDRTVCAGYTLAYTMLCNAVDIDTVSVTSATHAWNKVRLDGTWYNVDLTWGDMPVITYQFFERSDYYYDTAPDGQSSIHHAEEAVWNYMLPSCPIDTVQTGDYSIPGILSPVTETVAAPVAEITSGGKIRMYTGTPGSDIYYTTDNTRPSPSATKGRKYQGEVKINTASTLRIMAAYSGKYDSAENVYATVVYNGNKSSSGDVFPQLVPVGGGITLQPGSFQRTGYTFAGWNTKADGTGTSYKPGQYVTSINGGITLFAQWSKAYDGKYQIIYQLNGGKNSNSNPTGYTPGKNIKLKNPTKKGYAFAGWYTNKNLTKKFSKITDKTKGTLTLYAKWKKNKYNITYKLNGGKNNNKNPKYYYITSKTIKLKNPTRKGYKFAGWYSNKKCTKKVLQIKKGSTGKLTLYAKWRKK